MSSLAGRGLLTSEHGCIVLGVHVMINTEVLHLHRDQLRPRHLVRYQKSPRLARSTILRRAVRVRREYTCLRSHFFWYPGASSCPFAVMDTTTCWLGASAKLDSISLDSLTCVVNDYPNTTFPPLPPIVTSTWAGGSESEAP